MRSKSPPLLPIFRTRTQGEILALVLDQPNREWTISELATATEVALTSVQSEVARLEAGDLITSRKIGRNRLVRANKANPIIDPLTQVVLLSFGPKVVIAQEFAPLHADHVLIFGSWAARFAGHTGIAPDDIDVLVVGNNVSRTDVYAAAERAQQRIKRPVNPVVRSRDSWISPEGDPLLDEIVRRPYVDITKAPGDSEMQT